MASTDLSSSRGRWRLWLTSDTGRSSLTIGAVLAVLAIAFAWRGATAEEDAAMLFRYAENVARGHGIVWNLGDHPVDGATDMSFMLLLAVLKVAGIGVMRGALIVNSLAFVGTGLVINWVGIRRGVSRNWRFVTVLVFATGPGLEISRLGFGAVYFGLLVALSLIASLRLRTHHGRRDIALAVVAGLACFLDRPEGAIFTGVFLLLVLLDGGRLRVVASTVACLLLLGLAYVSVRWWYFGYPLPNPFYKKGGIGTAGFQSGVRLLRTSGIPVVVVWLLAALHAQNVKRVVLQIGAVAVMLSMWVFVSDEMNHLFRFQFPIVVVLCLLSVDLQPEPFNVTTRSLGRLVLLGCVAVTGLNLRAFTHVEGADNGAGRAAFAQVLRGSGVQGQTVATTEAGLVCWKSGWRCIDLWGLNDRGIAHNGYLNGAQLAALRPAVIVVHFPLSTVPGQADFSTFLPGWRSMLEPVISFAEASGYRLAAGQGNFFVYVRQGEAYSATLTAAFEGLKPALTDILGPASSQGDFRLPI